MSGGLDLTVQAPDLRGLYVALKGIEGNLRVELRRGIVAAAQPVADQIRQNASWSSRIPGAVKVKATFAASGAGVVVSVNAKAAPEAAPLNNGGSSGMFRHPVYADPGKTRQDWTWVNQQAQPFFQPAVDRADSKITTAIIAIAAAVEAKAGL